MWASNTAGRPAGSAIMQGDGNLVVYRPGGRPLWASNTSGNAGARLVVQDDGNVVIYRANGSPAWATRTNVVAGPAPSSPDMQQGEVLSIGQSIRSSNGRYTFVYQADGNLVLYGPRGATWASRTGAPVGSAVMQSDGNLVIYRPGGVPVWASNTSGNPGAHLVVQDDGNVVIYRSNRTPAWATNTNV
ncbi:curculin domain-containing protein [Nostocoides sp. F2B08]|nr:curculin domain-containing protein [Tetrasphaera sp. F2B08]